ncbi:Mss4-like protein, partial [Suillus occidentalis]
ILPQKGTEAPNTGNYIHYDAQGVYDCAACGIPLYKSSTKFSSGCGWSAFLDAIPGAVSRHEDWSRIEITCSA